MTKGLDKQIEEIIKKYFNLPDYARYCGDKKPAIDDPYTMDAIKDDFKSLLSQAVQEALLKHDKELVEKIKELQKTSTEEAYTFDVSKDYKTKEAQSAYQVGTLETLDIFGGQVIDLIKDSTKGEK